MPYTVYGVNGPVVTVRGGREYNMMDTVYVGHERLVGEVVGLRGKDIIVQVYEDTTGLAPGHPVESTGMPMSIQLGPGLVGNIFDGIARPLRAIESRTGFFMGRGINVPSLDADKKWEIEIKVAAGDTVSGGQVFAECQETGIIRHRAMVPPDVSGVIKTVKPSGAYTVVDVVAEIETESGARVPLTLSQQWPIRRPRPVAQRHAIDRPLITGQRIIDTLFPIAKGGCAAIPGPFGAGKTITQHQLAKWSDADIIVYLGCGERGNEMTQVLEEFSELTDPKSGRPLMERTVLIANTSNMPVAAREASIYTGMTVAEYFRDMGYHVAIMADSTSRWAEALREIAGRLEEMPAEEGFPAYLPSRLAEFYERAGYMVTLDGGEGSVTVIGAVSPQGGDFSEPVTQNTKRFIRCFWALDRQLAYARHFPAINWITSYSEYTSELTAWYEERLGRKFAEQRTRVSRLLQEESQLNEIVKLIGSDILPEDQKLVIEVARVVRLGFLQQNAYHDTDTYVPIEKQMGMLGVMLELFDEARTLIERNIPLSQLAATGIFERLIRMKYDMPNNNLDMLNDYVADIRACVSRVFIDNNIDPGGES
ncbi:MAG: V-type ATP synthase subunit A [Oscillospiraceae bacterium]|jgi:V/A-type H+-transporting ATPase subunit A|nr:V-type ATP synthase subunit A [Oscillospiraceae bacterium]